MIYGYSRTSLQETRQSGRAQKAELRKAGAVTIFSDQISGSKSWKQRPELSRLLETAVSGDIVVIYSLSRATRSLSDLLELITLLEERGIGLRSITEGLLDSTSASGRFLIQILGSVGELELEWNRQRVKSGLEAARALGHVGGRRPKLSAGQIETARTLRDSGKTINFISGVLDCSRPTVYKALQPALV